ncbi:hypothetical protein PhaeoP72_01188 [Phaeobacter inhibens]|nr:hypothetical protein PhaeoP72_01188 [Phaeobacter inhibens]
MTTEITQVSTNPALTLAQADLGTERLRHLLPSLRECPKARAEVAKILPVLSAPADPAWLMARIGALLLPYYEKDVPQSFREIEAEDWAYSLADAPQWAATAAMRWWKSADNPKRGKRPLEGDIQARIRHEMQAVRATRIALQSPDPVLRPEQPPRERVSAEKMAEIIESKGMTRERLAGMPLDAMPGCDFGASAKARAEAAE